MTLISKETFLKADDPRNRDALLFDMLESIDQKISDLTILKTTLKTDIERVEKKISYIKGVGATVAALISGILAWVGLK